MLFRSVASPAQYAHAKNSAQQAGVGAATNIVVDSDINIRGIVRPSTTAFELVPGKTYHLLAHGRFDTFSSGATGELTLRWVDDSNTNIPDPGTGPDATAALVLPTDNTGGASADQLVEAIYTVPASPVSARTVKVRCTAATGTAVLPANGMSVSIVEIK